MKGRGGSWYCWEVIGNGLCKGNRLRNVMNSGSVFFFAVYSFEIVFGWDWKK